MLSSRRNKEGLLKETWRETIKHDCKHLRQAIKKNHKPETAKWRFVSWLRTETNSKTTNRNKQFLMLGKQPFFLKHYIDIDQKEAKQIKTKKPGRVRWGGAFWAPPTSKTQTPTKEKKGRERRGNIRKKKTNNKQKQLIMIEKPEQEYQKQQQRRREKPEQKWK